MLIRSIRIAEEEPRMSSEENSVPLPSPAPSNAERARPHFRLSPAVQAIIREATEQRRQRRPIIDWRAIDTARVSPPVDTVPSVSGLSTHPYGISADAAASTSLSSTLIGRLLESENIVAGSADASNTSSSPQRTSVRTAVTYRDQQPVENEDRRWTLARTASSSLLQSLESNITSPTLPSASVATSSTFPAGRPTTTSGTIQDTRSTNVPITAAPTSTSTSREELLRSSSAHTGHTLASDLDEDRSPIQTTVDDMGRLVEQFRSLGFSDRDQFFHQVVTTIPPTTRSRNGQRASRRGGSTVEEDAPPVIQEARQDGGGVAANVGLSATSEGTRRLVLVRTIPTYPSLDA